MRATERGPRSRRYRAGTWAKPPAFHRSVLGERPADSAGQRLKGVLKRSAFPKRDFDRDGHSRAKSIGAAQILDFLKFGHRNLHLSGEVGLARALVGKGVGGQPGDLSIKGGKGPLV